jgi:hypothetical protein
MILTPEVLASLQNTLGPAGVLSMLKREQQAESEALSQRTAQATQTAQAAGQQYQDAAAAPPQDVGLVDQFVPTLLGNVASVIARDPSYRENARSNLRQQRQTLMQARLANLSALREDFVRAADSAQRAGDLEATIKARSNVERMSKLHDQLLLQQRQQHDVEMQGREQAGREKVEGLRSASELANIRATADEARKTLGVRLGGGAEGAGGAPSLAVENWAKMLETGQANIQNVPQSVRTAVVNQLASTGSTILPTKVRQTINDLGAAESVLDTMEGLVAAVNTGGSGASRFKAGAKSAVKGFLQTDVDDATYGTTMRGFLATIARSTGEKGVLTDRDSERARRLLPVRTDSKAVADKKIALIRQYIRGQKTRTVTNFTTPASMITSPWLTATLEQREDGKVFARRKTDGREGWIKYDLSDPDMKLFVPASQKIPQ